MIGPLVAAALLAASAPPEVVLSTPNQIAAFTGDGRSFAYQDAKDCAIRIGPSRRVVRSGRFDVACYGDTLTLTHARVVWGGYREARCPSDEWVVLAKGRVLERRSPKCFGSRGVGDELTAISAAGGSFFWAYVTFEETRGCAEKRVACRYVLRGGAVTRYTSGRETLMKIVPPASLLAAGRLNFAIVQARPTFTWAKRTPPPGAFPLPASSLLEVRSKADGSLIWSFAVDGEPIDLATTGTTSTVVSVLSRGRWRVEWFDGKGQYVRAVSTGRTPIDEVATDGRVIAYRAGRSIRALSATTGREVGRWTAGGKVVGPAVGGGKVTWAENVGNRGRILAVPLP